MSSFALQKYAAKGGPEFFFIVNIQVNKVLALNNSFWFDSWTKIFSCHEYHNLRYQVQPLIIWLYTIWWVPQLKIHPYWRVSSREMMLTEIQDSSSYHTYLRLICSLDTFLWVCFYDAEKRGLHVFLKLFWSCSSVASCRRSKFTIFCLEI